MSNWNPSGEASSGNNLAADRALTMLLLARTFVFEQFLKRLPTTIDAGLARRRWVLLQTMPASPKNDDDIFTAVFRSLRHGETETMLDFARTTLRKCRISRKALFLNGNDTPFYVVVDEAQIAAKTHRDCFLSTHGSTRRPFLHPLYRTISESRLFDGIIIVGTGLSIEIVNDAMGSLIAKRTTKNTTRVFTDIEYFESNLATQKGTDIYPPQETYIRQYLALSNNPSDRRLLERIRYWFSGRHVYVFASALCC